jgi:hypothetical protein
VKIVLQKLSPILSAVHSRYPWLAVAGAVIYLGLSSLFIAQWREARHHLVRASSLWGVLALTQLFLAADALYGLRMAIAGMGRELFREHVWYAYRWQFQAALTAVVLITLCVLL